MNWKEKRDRRRKTTCLVVVLTPIIIIGVYYVVSLFFVYQAANSFGKTVKDYTKRRSIKKQKEDFEFLYSNLLKKNQRTVFTGVEEKDSIIFTNALSITAIDSFSIKYRIESLRNWKSEDNIEGIATLDTANYNRRIVNFKTATSRSAFTFFEKKEDCQLEIYISKEKRKESLKALVEERCDNQETKQLTVIMNYK